MVTFAENQHRWNVLAGTISSPMRDILIQHIDGPVAYCPWESPRGQRVRGAVNAGLLHFNRTEPPQTTALTEKGRKVLCKALGEWADAIVAAQQRGLALKYAFQAA